MSNSPSNQPIRSISLPSRPHPSIPQIDEHLSRLRLSDSEADSPASESQLASLGHKLNDLKQLYDCLDDYIILPKNQQKLIQFSDAKRVDELIDGSLKLLDVCGNIKDVLSQVKEHLHEIQSSLRRRLNGELKIGDEIMKYVNMRKKTKFLSKKCLKDVKSMVKFFIDSRAGEENENKVDVAIINVLRKVEGVTAEIFELLLEVISGSKAQFHKKNKNNSSLSNIMCKWILHQNSDNGVSANEFDEVDSIFSSFSITQKKKISSSAIQGEKLRIVMVKLDSRIQDLDEVLEGLFRCLVRSRATLLNILSN